jgi:hypothetical protein
MTNKAIYISSRISDTNQHEGWLGYVNGGDLSSEEEAAFIERLMAEEEVEFDKLLPEGCFWQPSTGAIIGPIGTSIDDITVMNALAKASDRVSMRIEKIERDVLASL